MKTSKFSKFEKKLNKIDKETIDKINQENCKKLVEEAIHVVSMEAFDAINFLIEQTPYILKQNNLWKKAKEFKDIIYSFHLSDLNN